MENSSSGTGNYMDLDEIGYNRYNEENKDLSNTNSDDKSYFEVYSLLNRTIYDTSPSYSITSTNTALDYEYPVSGLALNSNSDQWNREEIWQEPGITFDGVYSNNFPPECPPMVKSQFANEEQPESDQDLLALTPSFVSYPDMTRKNTLLPCEPLTPYKLTMGGEEPNPPSLKQLTRTTSERTEAEILGLTSSAGGNQGREDTSDYQSPLLNQWVISNQNYPHSSSLSDEGFHAASRSRDPFHAAHRDSFGVSPDRSEQSQDGSWKIPKLCQPGSFEEEGDTSWSDSLSSCSSFDSTTEENVSDDADRSIEETLSTIHKPQLMPCEVSTPENLHSFLSPYEVGHINYLVKCYSDAIFSIGVPSTSIGFGKIISPISYLNLHIFGVLQVYYLMFKCEDYRYLNSNDQLCLLERNMIPVLISLGFMFFDGDHKCWRIPLVLVNMTSTLPPGSLLKFLPEKAVRNLIALCDASKELRVDKTISLLFVLIIIYTPVDKQTEKKLIDKLREKYVRILLQYLRWKFGSKNGARLFPEILKILDALLKFNEEFNDHKLRLNEDEIAMVTQYFKCIEQQTGSLFSKNSGETKDMFGEEMSYASFHAKLSSLLLHLGGD